MSLKNLNHRHLAIMRRLVKGVPPSEVALEFNISTQTINWLKKDPLFASELRLLEQEIRDLFVRNEADALQVMENAASEAASFNVELMRGSVVDPTVEDEDQLIPVPLPLRQRSAWDILDRSGFKPIERKVVGITDMADLIEMAYKKKHGKMADAVVDITPEDGGEPSLDDRVLIEADFKRLEAEGEDVPEQLNLFEDAKWQEVLEI